MPPETFGIRYEVAEDRQFRRIVRRGAVEATPELGHPVHPEVDGLQQGTSTSGDLGVTEVCFAVGCSWLGTFSSRFTELVGVPPSVYRRRVAKQVTRPIRNREAPVTEPQLAMTAMDITIHTTSLPHDDPDVSLAFYRDTLGFEVRSDVGNGKMRWIVIGPADHPDTSILLVPPAADLASLTTSAVPSSR